MKNVENSMYILDEVIERNVAKQTAYLEAVNDGILEGIEKSKKEIAKRMLAEKMSLETISRCVGLSIKEIKSMVL